MAKPGVQTAIKYSGGEAYFRALYEGLIFRRNRIVLNIKTPLLYKWLGRDSPHPPYPIPPLPCY